MAEKVRQKWDSGQRVIGYWQWSTDTQISEMLSRSGADVGLLDCQHGMLDKSDMHNLLASMKTTNCIAGVRIPSLDHAFIGNALDHGAELLVCPLVNNQDECEKFVHAAYYPPHGDRSFGPGRACLEMDMKTYFETVKPTHRGRPLLFAMIETEEGLANADEICSVDLLDGILIGPYDLSTSMGEPFNPSGERTTEAIKTIAAACAKHEKKLSIYSSNAKGASIYANGNGKFGKDFDLLFALHDTALLAAAAHAEVKELRGQPYASNMNGSPSYVGLKTE